MISSKKGGLRSFYIENSQEIIGVVKFLEIICLRFSSWWALQISVISRSKSIKGAIIYMC
jgi:hypothetical protein